MRYLLTSECQTLELGQKIANTLHGGEIILLNGQMGAGKTLLTKGIAVGLGILQQISSPTFTLLNSYSGRLTLHHYDLFRLQSLSEVEEAGLTEFLGDPNGVCVIEWPDTLMPILKEQKSISISLKYIDENTREAEIVVNDDKNITKG